MRFWQRDRELRRLERELRAARHEAPPAFIRALVGHRWLRPRLRIGVALAVAALVLAAMASAGGVGVVRDGTKAVAHVVKRTMQKSAPRVVLATPGSAQYVKSCSGPNDAHKCKITIFDASVKRPRTGCTTMLFTVSLDAPAGAPVTVNYSTRDGTATVAGNDYVATAGTLTFTAGMQSQTIPVTVCSGVNNTSDETFFVDLSGETNAEVVRRTATGTILR
jgi:hypothetical protein